MSRQSNVNIQHEQKHPCWFQFCTSGKLQALQCCVTCAEPGLLHDDQRYLQAGAFGSNSDLSVHLAISFAACPATHLDSRDQHCHV
jgi:hypothetical protein